MSVLTPLESDCASESSEAHLAIAQPEKVKNPVVKFNPGKETTQRTIVVSTEFVLPSSVLFRDLANCSLLL